MTVSYKKLWKLLIDKEMMKKDLRAMTGVSTTTMSRLSKDENVSTEILSKICSALNCDVGDIMEFVPDKKEPYFYYRKQKNSPDTIEVICRVLADCRELLTEQDL